MFTAGKLCDGLGRGPFLLRYAQLVVDLEGRGALLFLFSGKDIVKIVKVLSGPYPVPGKSRSARLRTVIVNPNLIYIRNAAKSTHH